jgi:hypothetical protein
LPLSCLSLLGLTVPRTPPSAVCDHLRDRLANVSIDGTGSCPPADPAARDLAPTVQHPGLVVLPAGVLVLPLSVVALLAAAPDLGLNFFIGISLVSYLASGFLASCLLSCPRFVMVGPVRRSELVSDSLPFPGEVGEDGKPQARYFSM